MVELGCEPGVRLQSLYAEPRVLEKGGPFEWQGPFPLKFWIEHLKFLLEVSLCYRRGDGFILVLPIISPKYLSEKL